MLRDILNIANKIPAKWIGYLVAIAAITIGAAIWQGVIQSDAEYASSKSITVIIASIPLSILTIYLISCIFPDNKSIKASAAERALIADLDQISSHIVQTNLKIIGNHIIAHNKHKYIYPPTFVDEIALRDLDSEFKIKETIASLHNVIQARQLIVSDGVIEIENQKKQQAAAVTAAASGFGGAFITYEIGQSIKNYWLLQNRKHSLDMNFWLTGTVQHFADPTKLGDTYSEINKDKGTGNDIKDPETANNKISSKDLLTKSTNISQYEIDRIQCQKNINSDDQRDLCELAKQPNWETRTIKLDNYLNEQFRQPEILAEAWLLTATLIVSLLAASIGWNKPQDLSDH